MTRSMGGGRTAEEEGEKGEGGEEGDEPARCPAGRGCATDDEDDDDADEEGKPAR